MSSKSILALAIVVIVLGAVLALTSRSQYTGRAATPNAVTALAKFDENAVRQIKLHRGDDDVVLSREGDKWVVPSAWNYAANKKKIDDFLAAIQSVPEAQVDQRASEAGSHKSFDLGKDKGCLVELTGEGRGLPLRLMIGKASGFDRCFIRVQKGSELGDAVYEVKPNLVSSAGLYGDHLKPADWVDKVISKLADDVKIDEITTNCEDGQIHLVADYPPPEKKDDEAKGEKGDESKGEKAAEKSKPKPAVSKQPTWRVVAPEKFEADKYAARGIASRLSNLTAYEPVDPSKAKDYGLDPPQRTATAKLSDGSQLVIDFGGPEIEKKKDEKKDADEKKNEKNEPKRYYVKKEGDSRIFLVSSWVRSSVFKKVDELRPKKKEVKAVPTTPKELRPPAPPVKNEKTPGTKPIEPKKPETGPSTDTNGSAGTTPKPPSDEQKSASSPPPPAPVKSEKPTEGTSTKQP